MKSYVKPPITRDKSSTTAKQGDIPKKSDNVPGRDSLEKQVFLGSL
jgi:hypothetical protein